MGMIPAQTQQVCQGENFDRTPGEDRSRCAITNMKRSPKARFNLEHAWTR